MICSGFKGWMGRRVMWVCVCECKSATKISKNEWVYVFCCVLITKIWSIYEVAYRSLNLDKAFIYCWQEMAHPSPHAIFPFRKQFYIRSLPQNKPRCFESNVHKLALRSNLFDSFLRSNLNVHGCVCVILNFLTTKVPIHIFSDCLLSW